MTDRKPIDVVNGGTVMLSATTVTVVDPKSRPPQSIGPLFDAGYVAGRDAERARVRALLAANVERMRTFDGYVLPSKALDAILGGEEVEAAREPREGAET